MADKRTEEQVNNLKALRQENVGAHIVVQTLNELVDHFDQMYVVAFDKKTGNPVLFATSDISQLPTAVLCLQHLAIDQLCIAPAYEPDLPQAD